MTTQDTRYHRHGSLMPFSSAEMMLDVTRSTYSEGRISDIEETGHENDQVGYDDEIDDDEDEVVASTKPRKMTERRRRRNAIADLHVQNALQKSLKNSICVSRQHDDQQSARWLVNQSESHQIISTPRAYQTELFEKAKEKNIIAVLDTGKHSPRAIIRRLINIGSGKTLIAVLLLRHTFAQELEDRAIGKPKRISFFLVSSQRYWYLST